MTIIFQGHVETLDHGATPGGNRITIRAEARRDLPPFTLEAFKGEATAYRPGTSVEVHIMPMSAELNYVTPWEQAFVQIAKVFGYKGEIWNAAEVVREAEEAVRRLRALKEAVG